MSLLIQSINHGMVQAEIDSALKMFKTAAPPLAMANSHLLSAKNIATPAFGVDPALAARIAETLAALKQLSASVEALRGSRGQSGSDLTEKTISATPDEQAR
jgi:hypothetical protein